MVEGFTLVEVPDGAAVEGPYGWALRGMQELSRVDVELNGIDPDLLLTAEEHAAMIAGQMGRERHHTVVLVAQESPTQVVAHASVYLPLRDNTHLAEFGLLVHPDLRRRGLGTWLYDWCESVARRAGRTSWQVVIDLGPGHQAEPRIEAPAGGWLYISHPAWSFASRRGWTLEQVESLTVLDLPVDPGLLRQVGAEAGSRGGDYRLQTWTGPVPPEWRAGLVALRRSFSTDAPAGGLDLAEEAWDEARLEEEMAMTVAMGRTQVTTLAIHRSSGEVAGFTELSHAAGATEHAMQWETMVAAQHRGHRLGTAVKVSNLAALARRRPDIRRIYTWNADQNSPMRAINDRLGFHPCGGSATLQRQVG